MAVFPEGTPGCRLDALAREPLWRSQRNFGHGTGHGVGWFLGVHEGPHDLRQNLNPTPLEPGMILSDEPGSSPSEARAKAAPEQTAKFYRTMFSNAGVSGGSLPDVINMFFDADIATPSSHPTGIEPTIQTIEADGTSRYFDLQGRMLNGKPLNGIFIYQGKKIITNK